LYYLLIKSRKLGSVKIEHIQARKPWRYIAKGFIINGLSPMVLIFWVGTISFATTEFQYTQPNELITYFASIVLTVYATDLIKATLADRLRTWLTTKIIKRMNFALGVALIFFGVRLLVFGSAAV
jgi:threonine/homoserine/homoserine lactone efflux protein